MAFSGAGTGVLGDPYQITTWAQFKEIKNDLTSHFLLMNNITATNAFGVPASYFSGVLDGGNYQVITLRVNSSTALLFRVYGGTVKNIKFTTVTSVNMIFGDFNNVLANENGIFENIEIINSDNYNLQFCGNIINCELSNITLKSLNSVNYIVVAMMVSNCTFTNVFVFAFGYINIAYGLNYKITESQFTDCKFISRPLTRSVATSNINAVRSQLVESTVFTHCIFWDQITLLISAPQQMHLKYQLTSGVPLYHGGMARTLLMLLPK